MILFQPRFTFFEAHIERRDMHQATVEEALRIIRTIELPYIQGNVEGGKSEKQIFASCKKGVEALYISKEHPDRKK
jgi:hypothetical protein